jgi:hypothetical protein
MMLSTAPFLEDVLLHRCLGSLDGLAYAELDPADPEEDSVSQWFDLSGWSGIIAVAGDKEAWRAARPNAAVIGADEDLPATRRIGFLRFARIRPDMAPIIEAVRPLIVVAPAAFNEDVAGYARALADAARAYLVRADHAAEWAPLLRSPRRDEFRLPGHHAAALGRMLTAREVMIASLHAERDAERARFAAERSRFDAEAARLGAECERRAAEIAARDGRIIQLDQEIAAREQGIAAATEEIAALRAALAAKATEIAALRPPAERLVAVANALDWPDAPRAIQTVLPLARLLRRVSGRIRRLAKLGDRK